MNTFSGKILLFGEYSLLYGSDALALPLSQYSGKFSFTGEKKSGNINLKISLFDYFTFLKKNKSQFNYLNLVTLEKDLNSGLFFESDIPQNYGLGSSGALVAAIFDRYNLLNNSSKNNLTDLLLKLADMESYFHGSSSGIDPLVSWLNKPVVIRNGIPEFISNEFSFDDKSFNIFLIDTNQESSTGIQISSFKELLKNEKYNNLFKEKYIPDINSIISLFIEKKTDRFYSLLSEVVEFQLKYFSDLFPSFTHELLREGIENKSYFLKLCGSGGGGFLLGFTQDLGNTIKLMSDKNVKVLVVSS